MKENDEQYIVHIWGGVESNLIPVKGSVRKTLKSIDLDEEDSVHLLTIGKDKVEITDFSGGYMNEIRGEE